MPRHGHITNNYEGICTNTIVIWYCGAQYSTVQYYYHASLTMKKEQRVLTAMETLPAQWSSMDDDVNTGLPSGHRRTDSRWFMGVSSVLLYWLAPTTQENLLDQQSLRSGRAWCRTATRQRCSSTAAGVGFLPVPAFYFIYRQSREGGASVAVGRDRPAVSVLPTHCNRDRVSSRLI
jgi:hypothetical protein